MCLKKLIVRVSVLYLSRKFITLATSKPREKRDGSHVNHNQLVHGHRTHELILKRLVKASEVLFFLDGGCQHLLRQSAKDAWNECII